MPEAPSALISGFHKSRRTMIFFGIKSILYANPGYNMFEISAKSVRHEGVTNIHLHTNFCLCNFTVLIVFRHHSIKKNNR